MRVKLGFGRYIKKTLNKLGLLRFARNDTHFLPVIARSEVTKQSIKGGYAGDP